MKYFLVSLQSHDLKSTVLVAMFVDLDTPLFERGAYVCWHCKKNKNKKDKKYMLFKLFPNWFFAELF